jgi:Arc/MetJ family transcription regulator
MLLRFGAIVNFLRPLDPYIRIGYRVYIGKEVAMAVTMTSIRLDTDLADEAVKVLKAKSRTDAVHIALREIVALRRFKKLMKKNEGKLSFKGYID